MDILKWWAELGLNFFWTFAGVGLFCLIAFKGPKIWGKLAELINLLIDYIKQAMVDKMKKEVEELENPYPEDNIKGDGAVK